jgi:hypothetical protein
LQTSPTVAGIPVIASDTAAGGFPELLFFMLLSTLLLLFLASVSVPAACILVVAGVPNTVAGVPPVTDFPDVAGVPNVAVFLTACC